MEHVETVIIGAGQAGLATAQRLRKRGRECVILDHNQRIGDGWRRQWDSLRLYSPARFDGLPGMRFPADPWSFPTKDDVAAYLEAYAGRWHLPVRLGTRVGGLALDPDSGFIVTTDAGPIGCDNVVVATGTFGRKPAIPDCSPALDPAILQLHSSEYRRPGQLRDGPVLVVGASHSGTDIAYELAQSRPTTLVGRDCGEIPIRLESRLIPVVFPLLMFAWRHVLTRRTPVGRREMAAIRSHGGPMLRVKRADLDERGVLRNEARVQGVRDGLPLLADGTTVEAVNVIWATGFRQTFDWIDLPILGADGWPREYRGVAEDVPGLYFCGLAFQYAFPSMLLAGAGRDAEHVVRHLTQRTRRRDHQAA